LALRIAVFTASPLPALRSWVESAQASDTDFPIQNLPFGVADGREPHAADLDSVLRPLLATDTNAAWSAKFTEHRVMHEALNSYQAFLRQPHVAESGAVSWTHHPHVPQAMPLPNIIGMPPFQDGAARTVAPSKGEHGVAILAQHGYSQAEIDSLIRSGILVTG